MDIFTTNLRRIINGVAVLVAMIGAMIIFHYMFATFDAKQQKRTMNIVAEPYFHMLDNDTHATTFHAGDAIFLHTEVTRSEECSVEANYRIMSERESPLKMFHRTVWYSYPPTRTVTYTGTYIADVRLELPSWLMPGEYLLDRTFNYVCKNNVKVQQVKMMPFVIVTND